MTLVLALLHRGVHHFFLGPIVLVVIVALVFFAVSRSRHRGSRPSSISASSDIARHETMSNSSAERILSEQFARGEIGLDDYRARLVALRDSASDGETEG